MDLFEHPLLRYPFLAVATALAAGLAYFVFLGVRALFREARGIAREAGHREIAASARAVFRMAAWAALFGVFYLAAFLLGRWLGWWAVPLITAGLVIMIGGLLVADRALTARPGDVAALGRITLVLAGIIVLFGAVIWTAARQ